MSGIDASKVYLPAPDQSATTGAVSVAPVGTAMPKTASEKLNDKWDSGGYVGDAGISISTNKGTTVIKDWSQGTVRKALSDFDGTISLPFLQIDEWSAKRLVGADNVHTANATKDHGNILAVDLGPVDARRGSILLQHEGRPEPNPRAWIPRGQIVTIDALNFVPNAANTWPGTLSCYTGDEGYAIRVIYEDGTIIDRRCADDTVDPSATMDGE